MRPVTPATIAHRVRALIPPGPRDAASSLRPRSSPRGPSGGRGHPGGIGSPEPSVAGPPAAQEGPRRRALGDHREPASRGVAVHPLRRPDHALPPPAPAHPAPSPPPPTPHPPPAPPDRPH